MPHPDLSPEVQQQIIEAFRLDRNAFEKVYNHYFDMIFRYLLKRILSAELAYDITADVFIKAFESFHKFQWTGVSIKVWLYRIAINSLKNARRLKNTVPLNENTAQDENLVTDVKNELAAVDKALFGDEELNKLSDAFATLKPAHQNVLSLYYFSGLSQKEISATIGRSVSAVKALMHRATLNLKQLLSVNPT